MKLLTTAMRLVVVNASLALVITIVFGGASWTTPWLEMTKSFSVSFLFTMCISPMCFTLIPRLAPFVARRASTPVYWTVLIAAMAELAAIGSLLALLILSAVGYIEATDVLVTW